MKQTQDSIFKEFYLKNSMHALVPNWVWRMCFAAFKWIMKIIHTVSGHTDDPG